MFMRKNSRTLLFHTRATQINFPDPLQGIFKSNVQRNRNFSEIPGIIYIYYILFSPILIQKFFVPPTTKTGFIKKHFMLLVILLLKCIYSNSDSRTLCLTLQVQTTQSHPTYSEGRWGTYTTRACHFVGLHPSLGNGSLASNYNVSVTLSFFVKVIQYILLCRPWPMCCSNAACQDHALF